MSGKGEDAGGCLMEGRVQLSLLLWRPGTSVLCAAGGQVPCSGTVLPDCACTTSPVSPVPGPTQGACHCLGGRSAGHVSKAPGSSDLLPRLRSTAHELVLQTCVCMCVRARVCMCVCAHVSHMPSFCVSPRSPVRALLPEPASPYYGKDWAPSHMFPDSHLPPPQGDT